LNKSLEGDTFALEITGTVTTSRWRKGRRVFHDAIAPNIVQILANMELPVNGGKESDFVLVDLRDLESGDFAPGPRRVVAVLQPLRGKDESSEEHAPTALQDPTSVRLVGLLHGEVMGGNVRLDQDQVVESHL